MKQKPTKKCENGVQLRPASIEEAGLFYSELDEKQDEALGTVGHIRMDFGSGGKEFWHTWWPHNEDRFNTLEFKEELQASREERMVFRRYVCRRGHLWYSS